MGDGPFSLRESVVGLADLLMQTRSHLADGNGTANQLRDEILQHIGLGDQLKLDVILLTQIIPVVRETSEAIMDRDDLEWLHWERV